MAEIVFIHGVGQPPGPGPSDALATWIEALAAPMPEAAEDWLSANSAMAYYQDWGWYAEQGEDHPRARRRWATMRESVSELADEARHAFETVDPDRIGDLREVADLFSRSDRVLAASNRVADQMTALNMWQVPALLADESGTRDEVIGRVADVADRDTRVVVAHSLGSVVAYEAIHALDLRLDTLITLGSPLGVPGYVYDRLQPAARFPTGLDRWVNICHPAEPVAQVHELAPLFGSGTSERTVHDVVIATDGLSAWHAIDTYLRRDEVRRQVWTAIGRFGDGSP